MNELVQMAVRFMVTGLSVVLVAALLPGMKVNRYSDAVSFAVVVAVLNVITWRVFALITVPLRVLTLGLAGFIINGLIFLVAKKFVSGVQISGCLVAAIGAFLVSVVNSVLFQVLQDLLR